MSVPSEELGDIALGDARLNRRARRLLQRLGDKPTVSIPAACGCLLPILDTAATGRPESRGGRW